MRFFIMHLSVSRRYIELQTPKTSIVNPFKLEGMKFDVAGVRFENALYTIDQAAIVSASLLGETAMITLRTGGRRKKFKPTSAHLKTINENHAEQDRELDDFFIYQRVPVNNMPSRTIGLRFTDRALEKFALDSQAGRARLRGHVRGDIVGRVFDGEVIDEEVRGLSAKWLLTTEYISRRTLDGSPMNEELLTKVVNGEYSFDSIGFYPGSKIEFKEFDSGSGRLQVIEIDYDESEQFPLEYREVSFVHLGELKGVGSRKAGGSFSADGDTLSERVSFNNRTAAVEVSGSKKTSLWAISI